MISPIHWEISRYIPDHKAIMMLRSSVKIFVKDSVVIAKIKVLIVSFRYDVSVMTSLLFS